MQNRERAGWFGSGSTIGAVIVGVLMFLTGCEIPEDQRVGTLGDGQFTLSDITELVQQTDELCKAGVITTPEICDNAENLTTGVGVVTSE